MLTTLRRWWNNADQIEALEWAKASLQASVAGLTLDRDRLVTQVDRHLETIAQHQEVVASHQQTIAEFQRGPAKEAVGVSAPRSVWIRA